MHTARSGDGAGSASHVVDAARRAGLDFLVITDHNAEDAVEPPRYVGGVLVLTALEKSTDAGHALVFGLDQMDFPFDGDPATVLRDAADLGGFVALAHPASAHPERRWSGALGGAAVLELASLGDADSWIAGAALPGLIARYTFDPQGALLSHLRLSPAALRLFDAERRRRPVAGFIGLDAHGGFAAGPVFVPAPSHLQIFRLARQHLQLDRPLTGDAARDGDEVLHALRAGHGYAGLDGLAEASSFSFTGTSATGEVAMGDAVPLEDGVTLAARAEAPPDTTLVLRRDGTEVARGETLAYDAHEAGSYRVEAHLDPRLVPGGGVLPWILSNPIDVYPRAVLQEREARMAAEIPPLDPPLPPDAETIARFDGAPLEAAWRLDRSPDSAARVALEAGALRFDFTLGAGGSPHVSLCDWEARDLRGAAAVTFRVRADRRRRFDFQVRTADADAPGGVRIFRCSVRAETEWRRTGVRLDALRSYDDRAGAPDLARVAGLYFLVEPAHLVRGGRGTLWIDDVAVAR